MRATAEVLEGIVTLAQKTSTTRAPSGVHPDKVHPRAGVRSHFVPGARLTRQEWATRLAQFQGDSPRVFLALGVRDKPAPEVMAMYLAPFAQRDSREPTVIFPREIIASSDYLAEVEQNLPRLAERPALIVWGEKDGAFGPAARVPV